MAKIHYDSYSFQPIAFVRTAARYRYEEPRQSVFSPTPAQLEFTAEPRFRDALADLDGFDRLWVVAVFHLNVNPDRTANWNPKVRPPVTPDDKKYGVFSTRSPHRPNPIALSCVEVEKIDAAKGIIHLRACDLLDGTPVLDIKPYIPEVDAFPQSAAGWRDRLKTEQWTLEFLPDALKKMDFLKENGAPDMAAFCNIQLSINPLDRTRKRLQHRSGNTYTVGCRTWKIVFSADEAARKITVENVESNYNDADLLPDAADPYEDKALHRTFLKHFCGEV